MLDLGFDPDDLMAPRRPETSARSYRPRCDDQYDILEGVCSSCGGLPLVPFSEAHPADTREMSAR